MDKYKVLIVYDVGYDGPHGRDGWAYYKRAVALKKYSPSDFDVTVICHAEQNTARLQNYQLCFVLDYMCLPGWTAKCRMAKMILVGSFNKDARSRNHEWKLALRSSDILIVNNEHRFYADGVQPNTVCISNGVDLETFKPLTPIEERPHKCLWTGGIGKAKLKNHGSVIEPLQKLLKQRGFLYSFRPITEINADQCYSTQQMVEWYNSGSYVLCASGSEGTPNSLLEGMACACIPIMTEVGNVPELIRHQENGLIVPEPDPKLFMSAIIYAAEHRERLSRAAVESVQGWGYGPPGNRANYFFAVFRKIINEGAGALKPFSYRDIHWEDI